MAMTLLNPLRRFGLFLWLGAVLLAAIVTVNPLTTLAARWMARGYAAAPPIHATSAMPLIQVGPGRFVSDPSVIVPRLEPWARWDLRREFEFNGQTYCILPIDVVTSQNAISFLTPR